MALNKPELTDELEITRESEVDPSPPAEHTMHDHNVIIQQLTHNGNN